MKPEAYQFEKHHSQVRELFADSFSNSPLFQYALPHQRNRLKTVSEVFQGKLQSHQSCYDGLVLGEGRIGALVGYLYGSNEMGLFHLIQQGLLKAPFLFGAGGFLKLARNSKLKAKLLRDAVNEHSGKKPFWILDTVAIHPDQRGKGLGEELVRAKLSVLQQKGLPSLVFTQDDKVSSFYSRLDYRVILTGAPDQTAPMIRVWWRS